MVDLITFAALYVGAILLFVFVMLFGESELFAGTPVSYAHWLLTVGICQGIERATVRLCGQRGRASLARAEAACCERPNPLVQLLFLAMLGASFHLYCRDIFPLLPLPGLPSWHWYTGSACVAVSLALFFIASVADPGYITPANVEAHLRLYPNDGMLFPEGRQCRSCLVAKPARSKHCKTCGRCVARFDHHCVWINNCVGLLNMRWFLAFLLSTSGLCFYGAVLGALIIKRDMVRRDSWALAYVDPDSGKLVYVGDSWRGLAHYMAAAYITQVALVIFLFIAGWLLLGFCGHQLWRIAKGITTNESFKRRKHAAALEIQREMERQRAEQEAITARILGGGSGASTSAAAAAAAASGASSSTAASTAAAAGGGGEGRGCGAAARLGREGGSRQQQGQALPNVYDRGAWANLKEVLLPWQHLRRAGQWRKEE